MFGLIFRCWCLGLVVNTIYGYMFQSSCRVIEGFWQDIDLLDLLDRGPLPLQLRRCGGDCDGPSLLKLWMFMPHLLVESSFWVMTSQIPSGNHAWKWNIH